MDKRIRKYLSAVKRRLNIPKKLRDRLLNDLQTTVTARMEQGESWDSIRESLGEPAQVAAEYTEQMKEFAYRKSPWRFAFLGAAILLGLKMGYQFLMELIALAIITHQNGAASVGIIGGADGPTAIFLTTSREMHILGSVSRVLLAFVICLLIYLRLRKCKQK